MKSDLFRLVRIRANNCCEYCLLPDTNVLPFQIDHIIAEQHGGETLEHNLAYSCASCNRYKGPNIASLDPDRVPNKAVLLFNPRTDNWATHFRMEGELIIGSTTTGRVTVFLLQFNNDKQKRHREMLIQEGLYPPPHLKQ